jgi:hypothetical protein
MFTASRKPAVSFANCGNENFVHCQRLFFPFPVIKNALEILVTEKKIIESHIA